MRKRFVWRDISIELGRLAPLQSAGILIPGDYQSPAKITWNRIRTLKLTESVSVDHAAYLAHEIMTHRTFVTPIVDEDYVVLDGHHRIAAMTLLGAKIIPVRVVWWS